MKLPHLLAIHPGLSVGVFIGICVFLASMLGSLLIAVGQVFHR